MLTQIPRSIEEDYVIIFQWDGFALNREMFSDEFLNYDYIGAPWPSAPAGFEVGNGGFSLRSRRLLDRLLLLEAHLISDVLSDQPEDLRICVHIRNILTKLGIVFAPTEIARKFSFEWVPRQGTFGFHGVFNLPLLLKKEALTTHMPEILGRVKNPQLLKAMHLNARLVGANSFKTT
jgi:hypothetical protein